ncbi:MAG: lanthionine synthetase C family protein [Myxococcales bacterium]|nr:lanthionine synthetase C family protein [Myxococcales bacterium]
MKAASPWRPLLTGASAERARAIIDDIALGVRQSADAIDEASAATKGTDHPWHILLPAYRWAEDNQREDDAAYVADGLERFAANIVDRGFSTSLFSGVGALTWLHAHLTNELFEPADEEAEAHTDDDAAVGEDAAALILARLRAMPNADYDLISGLVGVGIIGLEMANAPEHEQIVTEVLGALHKRSLTDDLGGRYWLTSPELLPQWQRKIAPEGYYNLGLAHGMPGVAALAAECHARGLATDLSASLATSVVDWLLRARKKDSTPGFSGWIEVGSQNAGGSQLAWCYGGLGVSATILRAAQVFNRSDWRQQAIEIARACASAAQVAPPLRDHALCHGSAGNAHVFNRLYQATGDEPLREAALAYFEATLAAHRPGEGIGGYQAWGTIGQTDFESLGHQQGFVDDISLLTGSSGIGLALQAAVSQTEPNWDRALMVNTTPMAPTR